MRTLLFAGILASCAWAQGPTDPPPIIQLTRTPGIGGGPIRRYAEANAAVNVVGMTAMTGLPETWLIELHPTFGSIEDLDRGLIAAPTLADNVLAPSKTTIATYQPNWSYRPDQAIRLFGKARYFHVSIYRIRAGTEADFGELVKLRRVSQDSVNLDRPEIAYEVISGEPSGTFIFLAPITSLKTFDEGVAAMPVYAEGVADARSKARAKVAPDSELSREHLLFRVEPRLSYVSDGFASMDPNFWRPKPGGQ
ncbi:MAG TPA: hypothetical protein VGZ73_13480 [Bryobacteraceae bacterium]|jgi:hypothetical protein|nr:hypothetical protein [Bryobacteraceae bacterium]